MLKKKSTFLVTYYDREEEGKLAWAEKRRKEKCMVILFMGTVRLLTGKKDWARSDIIEEIEKFSAIAQKTWFRTKKGYAVTFLCGYIWMTSANSWAKQLRKKNIGRTKKFRVGWFSPRGVSFALLKKARESFMHGEKGGKGKGGSSLDCIFESFHLFFLLRRFVVLWKSRSVSGFFRSNGPKCRGSGEGEISAMIC